MTAPTSVSASPTEKLIYGPRRIGLASFKEFAPNLLLPLMGFVLLDFGFDKDFFTFQRLLAIGAGILVIIMFLAGVAILMISFLRGLPRLSISSEGVILTEMFQKKWAHWDSLGSFQTVFYTSPRTQEKRATPSIEAPITGPHADIGPTEKTFFIEAGILNVDPFFLLHQLNQYRINYGNTATASAS